MAPPECYFATPLVLLSPKGLLTPGSHAGSIGTPSVTQGHDGPDQVRIREARDGMRRQYGLEPRVPSPEAARTLRQSLKIGNADSVNIKHFPALTGPTTYSTRAPKLPIQAFRKSARIERQSLNMSEVLSQIKKNIHTNPMTKPKMVSPTHSYAASP